MDAREFTWKMNINPKADFASLHMWQGESGDAVAYEDAYKSYQFGSCLRSYLLVKTSIRYPKTALKASLEPCASRKRAKSTIRNTPNSIGACARKQGIVATSSRVNRRKKYQNTRAYSAWLTWYSGLAREVDRFWSNPYCVGLPASLMGGI